MVIEGGFVLFPDHSPKNRQNCINGKNNTNISCLGISLILQISQAIVPFI